MRISNKILAVMSLSLIAFSGKGVCSGNQGGNQSFTGFNGVINYSISNSDPNFIRNIFQPVAQVLGQALSGLQQNNMTSNMRTGNQQSSTQNNGDFRNGYYERGCIHVSCTLDSSILNFVNSTNFLNNLFQTIQRGQTGTESNGMFYNNTTQRQGNRYSKK